MTAPASDEGPDGRAVEQELRSLGRSGGLSLLGGIVNALLGFVLVVVVSRALGAAGAGVFSVTVALFMIVTTAGRLGADTALVRALPALRAVGRGSEVRAAVRVALVPVVAVSVVTALAAWVAAPLLARAFLPSTPAATAVAIVRMLAGFIPLATGGYVALAATRGMGTVRPLVVVENVVKPIARVLGVLVALAAGGGLVAVLTGWAVPTLLGAGLAAVALIRRLPPRAHRGAQPGAVRREIWTFAAPRGVAALFEIAGMHVGLLLVSALLGAAGAGIYNGANRLVLAGTLAMQAIRLGIAPQLSRLLAENRPDRVESVHRAATAWIVLLSWPLYLLLLLWPAQAMAAFGPQFVAGAPALAILAAATLVNLATGNVQTVLLMSGRSGVTLLVTVGSVALNALLTLALAPVLGVTGAAVARAAATVFENVAVTLAVRRYVGVRTVGPQLMHAVVVVSGCFLVPALALRLLSVDSFVALCVSIAVSVALYGKALHGQRQIFELPLLMGLLARRRAASATS